VRSNAFVRILYLVPVLHGLLDGDEKVKVHVELLSADVGFHAAASLSTHWCDESFQ